MSTQENSRWESLSSSEILEMHDKAISKPLTDISRGWTSPWSEFVAWALFEKLINWYFAHCNPHFQSFPPVLLNCSVHVMHYRTPTAVKQHYYAVLISGELLSFDMAFKCVNIPGEKHRGRIPVSCNLSPQRVQKGRPQVIHDHRTRQEILGEWRFRQLPFQSTFRSKLSKIMCLPQQRLVLMDISIDIYRSGMRKSTFIFTEGG